MRACPNCERQGLTYDRAARMFVCLFCRWRDRVP